MYEYHFYILFKKIEPYLNMMNEESDKEKQIKILEKVTKIIDAYYSKFSNLFEKKYYIYFLEQEQFIKMVEKGKLLSCKLHTNVVSFNKKYKKMDDEIKSFKDKNMTNAWIKHGIPDNKENMLQYILNNSYEDDVEYITILCSLID